MARSPNHAASANDPLPPDERFWKRYSPHHEALLSGVGSLTVHGLVVGIMILAGWAAFWVRNTEAQRPPKMDVVKLVGTDGDGSEGGGSAAPLGSADGGNQQEAVEPKQMDDVMIPPTQAETNLTEIPTPAPKVAESAIEDPKAFDDLGTELAKISKDASKLNKPVIAPPATKVRKTAGPRGVATGQTGGKGLGGSGGGTGTGKGKGNGAGSGGLPGRPMTKQEIFAQRWRFNLTGNGKEHADKLIAAGVILVIHDQLGHAFVIRDLRRRPIEAAQGYPAQFKDAVKWYNRSRPSINSLGQYLLINNPELIGQLELLLPKEREEKMAEAEAVYARQQGRPLDRITETLFDFRLVNGRFEPVVISQN